ncbi:MAG: IMP dehydrogenase [Candidatus Nanoarchaeia archaeon]|nr:IMP dehydrogenase [Candidatus Nanoarchaeia archaeon]
MESSKSGISAEKLFKEGLGINYDDFTILDTSFTDIDREEINLETSLGKNVVLKTPIIASPMDTVTNAEMCIAIALQGGIGCIHYNFKNPDGSLDIDKQAEIVKQVKRFENGFIENPVTVSPEHKIYETIKIGEEHKVGKSAIDTFPVTENGKSHGKVVGILRKQDYSRTKHTNLMVKERMIPLEKLIMAEWPITLDEANDMLWDNHILSLPIVENGNLKYLVTRSDLDKNEEYPLATKDDKKRLRVLFAVETRPEIAYERLEKCFNAGADGCIIDTSQGYTKYERDMAKYIEKKYTDKLLIGGNISTKEACEALEKWGLDAYRCGQGSGSICTTAGAIGISSAPVSAVYDCAKTTKKMKTIADGGIKQVGDIVKALAVGADAVMLGNMLAGTEESPGDVIIDPQSGLPIKGYRGMGSKEANVSGIRGYSRLPQGFSGYVKYRDSIHEWVPLIIDGIISGFHVKNCKSIKEIHKKIDSGDLRFQINSSKQSKEKGLYGPL